MSRVSVEYNSYAEYLNTWQEAIEANMFPIHVMYFEDLKKVKKITLSTMYNVGYNYRNT